MLFRALGESEREVVRSTLCEVLLLNGQATKGSGVARISPRGVRQVLRGSYSFIHSRPCWGADWLQNGNNAAGTRARKILQEIKAAAQELRVAIQETKAEMAAASAAGAGDGAAAEQG